MKLSSEDAGALLSVAASWHTALSAGHTGDLDRLTAPFFYRPENPDVGVWVVRVLRESYGRKIPHEGMDLPGHVRPERNNK